MKWNRKIEQIACTLIAILTAYICILCCINGMFVRVLIDINEKAYLVKINPFVMLAGMGTVIFFLVLIWKYADKLRISSHKVFVISMAVSLFWVLVSQNYPSDDAGYCFKIAAELMDGITHSFDAGQYLDTCHQQYGLVELICALSVIGGQYNYLLFQIVNSVVFAFMCYETFSFIKNRSCKLAIITFIILLMYFPIWLFNTYCYGNILGTSLGIIAIIKQLRFLQTGKWKNAIVSSLFISFAIALKMYSLIYLIAMVIIYIFNFINNKKYQCLSGILIMLLLCFAVNVGVNAEMKMLSRGSMRQGQGYSLLGAIVMGLNINQEQSNPGWYTGENVSLYYQNDFNRAQTTQKSKQELEDIFNRMTQDPVSFIQILLVKNQTIWNEPTFDIMYRNRIISKSSLSIHGTWYSDFIADSGRLHRMALVFIACLQVIVYAGTILYLVIEDNRSITKGIGLIIFIGGVLFLLFWEGKSEYAMQFFLPLIYYASNGYMNVFNKIYHTLVERTKHSYNLGRINYKAMEFGVVVIGACITLVFFRTERNDNKLWDQYIDEHYYISSGNYDIATKVNDEVVACNIYINFEMLDSEWTYVVYNNAERYYFKFLNWDEIDMKDNNRMIVDSDFTVQMTTDYSDEQNSDYHWIIQRKNGGYLIRSWENRNKVWTYDGKTRQIQLMDFKEDNINQIWQLYKN